MNESREIRNLRSMAWERAKGELQSMTHTFWGSNVNFEPFKKILDKFIKDIEDMGLHE